VKSHKTGGQDAADLFDVGRKVVGGRAAEHDLPKSHRSGERASRNNRFANQSEKEGSPAHLFVQ
jgi:hypothetical protein